MSAVQTDGGYDFVSDQVFENTFTIADIATLDDETLADFVTCGVGGMTIADIGLALHDAPSELVERFIRDVSATERADFTAHIRVAASHAQVAAAEQRLVDALFWELTYWKTPELYEELTEGELLHPGIFEKLGPELRDKVVLDAGAGTGRATFDCVRQGARQVYAVDPSPGLLRLLRKKIAQERDEKVITPLKGRFDALPLDDASIDVTIACAAFTADDEHGGERGLTEMRRVTKAGGMIVIIWPRPIDGDWLAAHGFQHVEIPTTDEMAVHYRSFGSALHIAQHFYAHNPDVLTYLLRNRRPDVPFSILGMNPPTSYAWLRVEK